MEVHTHSHTSRKKWTHYFWEFFMLFLAVTLGFLVENWREHVVEHRREKQFIETLIEDLKSDTSQLNLTIEFRLRKEKMVDSLAFFMKSPERNKHGSEIYYYVRSLSRNKFFLPNDRTIQQLKNSGNLRLIHNINVSNNIMSYDQQLRYLVQNYDQERQFIGDVKDVEKYILDGYVLLDMIDPQNLFELKRPIGNPPLLTQSSSTLNELIVQAQFVKSIVNVNRQREEKIKQTAAELISFLKKEYHLK
jgi:hypothetical protein